MILNFMRVQEKTVVITGAANGIGAALARLFDARGLRLGLLDAVLPGEAEEQADKISLSGCDNPDEIMQENGNMHLTKRIGTPEEVAALVAFLCQDIAGFITGQAIRIDGGLGLLIPRKQAIIQTPGTK